MDGLVDQPTTPRQVRNGGAWDTGLRCLGPKRMDQDPSSLAISALFGSQTPRKPASLFRRVRQLRKL
jgi:hypothetical protein